MTFQCVKRHEARKQHRCGHCGKPIEPGTTYLKSAGVFDGQFYSLKSHEECDKAWNWWNWDKDGPRYGDQYEGAPELYAMEWEETDKPKMKEKFPVVYDRLWGCKPLTNAEAALEKVYVANDNTSD